MVTPVRPNLTPPAGPAAGSARTAAQRAFFDQAMGRAAPATATAPAVQAQPTPPVAPVRPAALATANPMPEPSANPGEPVRYRRPGSILDIKV